MIEQNFKMTSGDQKTVEKMIMDDNLHYMHMIFNQNEGLPEHYSNSNLYMTVLRGTLSIQLGDQDNHEYDAGTILKIPYNTKMNVRNLHQETLELIVVKAPAPQSV
ncbi:MAG: cupin domain-containing protein [Bacillota bacterium]